MTGDSPLPTPVSPVSPIEPPAPPLPTPAAPDSETVAAAYELIADLMDMQSAHYLAHGRYAQLLMSPGVACPDGEACVAFFGYPRGLRAAVDIYQAPEGEGYVIRVESNGWQICVSAGPEGWRSEGWHYAEN